VRNALGSLARRMTRKLSSSSTKQPAKLEGLVEVRREAGSATHRLHRDGRLAKFLKGPA
jgi:hypothetical protein